MNIEEEIQIKDFKDSHRRMIVNLMFTGNYVHNMVSKYIKPFGISLEQHNVLGILRGQYPSPTMFTTIQSRMYNRNSNVTRLVDKLVDLGYATRELNPNHRRKMDICITEKGLSLLTEIDKAMPDLYAEFHSLSAQEADTVSQLLDKMRG
ncbi:MAG: MarR family transcriptional regulator [Bacteroidota bacterium]